MTPRSIKVKVLKETDKTVTVKFIALNRKMPVSKREFEERVASGLYDVINAEKRSEEKN